MSSPLDPPPAERRSDALRSAFSAGTGDGLPAVYGELRRLAAGYLRNERPDHTLQATALVHEAYLRLADQREMDWNNRAQVIGLAAQMMRRILVNHALARGATKRGGSAQRLPLDLALEEVASKENDAPLVSPAALDQALTSLEALDPRQGKIVELRFFGGLTTEEVADVLEISPATVKREWSTARRWLRRKLDEG